MGYIPRQKQHTYKIGAASHYIIPSGGCSGAISGI
jgi:hypothetical protein